MEWIDSGAIWYKYFVSFSMFLISFLVRIVVLYLMTHQICNVTILQNDISWFESIFSILDLKFILKTDGCFQRFCT